MQTQPIAYHIVLKLTDNRVIIDQRAKRVRAVRALIALGREARLLAFRFVDTHVHLEVACSRATAGQLARRLELALRHSLKLPVPFQPAFFEPVWRQGHLQHLQVYPHPGGASPPRQ